MEYQILFSRKNKKKYINLSFAEFAHSMESVSFLCREFIKTKFVDCCNKVSNNNQLAISVHVVWSVLSDTEDSQGFKAS